MKAAVLHRTREPLVIEDVQLSACREEDVRIQVAASGLCHSDYHLMTGDLKVALPAVLGHEVAGIVIEVGPAVRGISVGDHVVTCLSSSCGHCRQCQLGSLWRCMAKPAHADVDPPRLTWQGQRVRQLGGLGGFAEQALVHRSAVAVMPRELPLDRVAVMGCAVITGVGAAINTARIRPTQTVAVVGCGGIGLNVIQGARLAGAQTIVAIDRVPAKLELATRFGATHTLLGGDATAQEVIALTQGGVDHAFEAIGLPRTQELAFATLAPGGTLTLIGVPPMGSSLTLPHALMTVLSEKKIQGSMMGSSAFQQDLPRFGRLYLDGRLNLDDLIARHLTLEDINLGFDAMLDGSGGARSVVVFDDVLREAARRA